MKEFLLKVKKLPWKFIVPVILVVTIALNIWLLCMPVFKGGAYVGQSNSWYFKISFNNVTCDGQLIHKVNTATTSKGNLKIYGFYVTIESDIKIDATGVLLAENKEDGRNQFSTTDSYRDYIKRKNVFTITTSQYIGNAGYEHIDCINAGAVVLQIFYIFIILTSGFYTFKYSMRKIKEQKIKKVKTQIEKQDNK